MSIAERGAFGPDDRGARAPKLVRFPDPSCPELTEAAEPERIRIGQVVFSVHELPPAAADGADRAVALRPGAAWIGPTLVCRQLPLGYTCSCGHHRGHDPCVHVTALIRLGHLDAIEASDPADWLGWTDADCWILTPPAAERAG